MGGEEPPESPDDQDEPALAAEEAGGDLVRGPKSQAVMNGPQYTMPAKAREPSEVDLPSPHEDA